MKRAFRLIAPAAALGAALLGLTACDGSPPAATVGGQVLSVSAFNHQLAQWVSDASLVQQLNQSAAANAASEGGPAETVGGAGGSGTYSLNFADQILEFNVEVIAVREYLARHGQAPTQDELDTALAYEVVNRAQYWDSLPPPLQEFFVDELADEGVLTPAPSDTSSFESDYSQIQPWLFSSLCVIEAVTPEEDAAKSVVASGQVNGARVCFNQQEMEAQPQAFQSAVTGLTSTGQIAPPIKTSFGYQVVELSSRSGPALDAGVAQVLTATQTPPNQLQTIITNTRIVINPLYGSWSQDCLVPPGSTVQEACGTEQ